MSKRRKSDTGDTAKRQKPNRFDAEQDSNNSQILFTIDEKRNFLKACQENGLSVIYDLKRLGEYLPARSETEIRYLIDVFERKSRYKKENADFDQTPLESWYSLCDQLIRSQVKREDSSMLLIDLMSRYSAESSKYGSIYGYLQELMEGRYTSKLSAHDSIVFLCLIDTLSSFVQSQDLSAPKDYLRRLHELLNEQLTSGEQLKRRRDEVSSEYLNYFQQIDPSKLRDDIRLASAQLNRSRVQQLDQQVAASGDERQLASRSQASPSQISTSQASSPQATQDNSQPTNQDQQVNPLHLAEQVVNHPLTTNHRNHPSHLTEETSEQTRSTDSKTAAKPTDRQASACSFVSVTNRDDESNESNESNLTNQHSSNKQAPNRDLISEKHSDARFDESNLAAGSTQQAATGRPNQGLLKSQNPLYQYSQLPRIDKMRECLNPLGVSVEVLRNLHSSLKNFSF